MPSKHNTQIIGHVGKDAELRYTQGGAAVASFSVAVTEKWNDSAGNPQSKTTWYKVTTWRGLAETCSKYVKKGMLVFVEGTASASAYLNQAGEPQASLELNAKEVLFLSKAEGAGNQGSQSEPDNIPF